MAMPLMRSVGNDDIQLLRYWRNLEHVRSAMTTNAVISHHHQRDWYAGLSANNARHFVYALDDIDVGSFNLSRINFETRSFEGGIYCGNSNYFGHWINFWACIQLYDIGFESLNLDTSTARIMTTNLRAIRLNKEIGYTLVGEAENGIGNYVLTKAAFRSKTKPLKSWLKKFELNRAT